MFILSLGVDIATRDRETAIKAGPTLLDLMAPYIVNAEAIPAATLYKSISYTFAILKFLDDVESAKLDSIMSDIARIKPQLLQAGIVEFKDALLSLTAEDSPVRSIAIQSKDYWLLISHVAGNPVCAQDVLGLVTSVVKSGTLFTEGNFTWLVDVISAIARGTNVSQKKPVLDRRHQQPRMGVKDGPTHGASQSNTTSEQSTEISAVETLFGMESIVADVYKAESTPKAQWTQLWSSYVSRLGSLCTVDDGQVRAVALNSFQRAILDDDVHLREGFSWNNVFDGALFPLINNLLRPEVYERDPQGMASTRSKVASLTCKVFLQYALQNQKSEGEVLDMWVRILSVLDRLINSGQKDSLRESVVESLKNVVLVLKSSNAFASDRFWNETWKRIDSFLPDLQQEIEEEPSPADHDKLDNPANDTSPVVLDSDSNSPGDT
jgi:brefeldin A-resistance guanine nucleotide exchange factor 1